MKTKLNRLLALVMALMMVFQMPVSALADGRTTYQAPSFNLGDLIPVDQVSYQVAVEHYTTDGTAIAVEGAPASWTISGREVSREIDASVTINDPTYVYQYAVLQSTEKDNLAFETKGIGIDKHGMLCALNKQTGEMNPIHHKHGKGDFVLKLYYEEVIVVPEGAALWVTGNNYEDTTSTTLTAALEKLAKADNVGDVTIVFTDDTAESMVAVELPKYCGMTSLTLKANDAVTAVSPDGTALDLYTMGIPVSMDKVSADLVTTGTLEFTAPGHDVPAVYEQLKSASPESRSATLNSMSTAELAQTLSMVEDAQTLEDWTSGLTRENYNAWEDTLNTSASNSIRVKSYAPAATETASEEVAPAAVSTFALRSSAAAPVAETENTITSINVGENGKIYTNKRVTNYDETTGEYEITIDAWQYGSKTISTYMGYDIVLVMDTSGSMAFVTGSDGYAGSTYSTSNGDTFSDYGNELNSDTIRYYKSSSGTGHYYRVFYSETELSGSGKGGSYTTHYYYTYRNSNGNTVQAPIRETNSAYTMNTTGDYVSRSAHLKTAVNTFVNNVNAAYTGVPINYQPRFSIVTFASYGTTDLAFPDIFETAQDQTTHLANVRNAINGMSSGGGTKPSTGMSLAASQLGSKSNKNDEGNTINRKQMVIVFTDGVYTGDGGDTHTSVSDQRTAIQNQLDTDGNSTPVYGIFFGNDTNAETNMETYVVTSPASTHFYAAADQDELLAAFQDILDEDISGVGATVNVLDEITEQFVLSKESEEALIAAGYTVTGERNSEGLLVGPAISKNGYEMPPQEVNEDGSLKNGATPSIHIVIKVTRNKDFVGDNSVQTNEAGSGITTLNGEKVEFNVPTVNVPMLLYGENVEFWRLVGTTENVDDNTIYDNMYSAPDYDPDLGEPKGFTGSWYTKGEDGTYTATTTVKPAVDNVVTEDVTYYASVNVIPMTDVSAKYGPYNPAVGVAITNSDTSAADRTKMTATFHAVKPTFKGGSMELFLGEIVGDIYTDITALVTANFTTEDAAHFTTDEINAYKANIKYYVGDVELKDYVPSSTDAGTVTVTAKYNGVELGTAKITLTLHKGAIQVTKTTSDGSAATVTFEVTADKLGAVAPSLEGSYTVVANNATGTIVGANSLMDAECTDASCTSVYTLPMGAYTVREKTVNPDNYTEDTTTTRTVTLGRVNGEFVHTGSVNLVNTRRTTSATITKAAADTTQPVVDGNSFTMQAYLDGVAYGDPFTLAFGESETFDNLPVGANFKVVETDAPAYYTTTYSAEDGITLVDAAASNTLTVTNTRGEAGAVVVKKVTVPATDTTVFAFTYSINGGEAKSISVTANDAKGATIPGLLKGDKLVITEIPDANYTLTGAAGTANVDGSLSGNAFTVDHVMGAGEVTFTNARNAASLTVEKTVVDDTTTARPYAFQFQAVKGAETLTFEVTWNGTAYVADTETGLLAGDTWTVTETDYKWAQADTEWIPVDTNYTNAATPANGVITLQTGTNTVAFTNTRKAAGISVAKVVDFGNTEKESTQFELDVTITKPGEADVTKTILAIVTVDGENIAYTYKEKGSAEAAVAGAYPLANLPVGTTVAIAETANGWNKDIPEEYEISEGDTTAKVLTVSNTRVETTVTGTKTWVDESDKYGLRPDSVELTLLANGTAFEAEPTWTNTNSNEWTYTYTNLPTHTVDGTLITYTVEETQVENYQAPTYDETHLNITNTLNTSRTVVVTKHWNDNGLAVNHTTDDVAVTLTYEKDGKTVTFEGTATAAGEGNTFTYTFTGVPMGLALKANEAIDEELADNYTSSANPVDVVNDVAEFTNTRKLVDVTVKKLSADAPSVNDDSFTVKVTVNGEAYANQTAQSNMFERVTTNANGEVTMRFEEEITFKNLPVDSVVAVEETAKASYYKAPGYNPAGASLTLGLASDENVLTITNQRQTATLELSKTSDFAQSGDTITLTVTGPVVEINDRIASINKDGKQTVNFTYNGSAWATTDPKPVLLVGQTYTVTEAGKNADLFTSSLGNRVEVVGGTNTALAVTNIRKTTSLTLEKNVINPVNDTEFTFTLTSANLAGKTYGDVVFNQDGKANVTVANNGSKTIEKLPVGVVIDIVETGAGNYDTTINGTPDADKATEITLAEAAVNNVVTYANTRTVTSFNLVKECANPVPVDQFTITVTGAYAGNDSDDAERTYTFKVEDGKVTPASVKVPSLKGATYTVVETAVNSSAANYTTTGEIEKAAPIADGETVTITNTRDFGAVVIAKIAVNTTADAGETFTFTGLGNENKETLESPALNNGGSHVWEADGGPILAGETVTITETANASYTTSYILVNARTLFNKDVNAAVEEALAAGATWQEGLAGNVTAYAADEEDANRMAIVFKNVRKAGMASVKKTITNPASVLDAETFSITLTGNMLVKGADGTYTLQNTTTDAVPFTKSTAGSAIPLGEKYLLLENEKYTVKESMTGGDLDNYVVTGANQGGSEYTYTAANATAVVNNQKSEGGIKVSKTVSGYSAADENFTLEITGNFAAGSAAAQNGKLVVTLAKGETKELSGTDGIILGQEYTVTETGADNYTTVYTVGATETNKVTAAATAPTLVVANTRTTGDLTVKKTAANATAQAGLDFTFTISTDETDLANQKFATTAGEITFGGVVEDKVSATLTLTVAAGKASEAQTTISGLPKGVTFTVTENVNDNYTVTDNGQTAAIGDTVTVTNTRKTGTMTLTKTADYQVEKDRTYWFRVNGIFENEVTNKWVSITLTKDLLTTGNTATVDGLLDGESYTITEVTDNGSTTTVTDYTMTVKGGATFTFDADNANFAVNADNAITKGTVGVGKVAVNGTDDNNSFTFTLTGQTSGHKETVTLPTDEDKWYATFNTFFAGEQVIITETANDNFTTYVKGAHSASLANGLTADKTTKSNTLTVTALDAGALLNTSTINAAVFTNERNTADGKITKVLNNASLTLDTESFVITVTGEMLVGDVLKNGEATATIAANSADAVNNVKTWTDVAFVGPNQELIMLLDGETYTLSEVIYNAEDDITGRYTVTGTGEFTYNAGSTYTVTNEKNPAKLYVAKVTSGYVDEESFDVKVSGNFAAGTEVDENGYVTVTVPVGGTVEVPNVILGETYEVKEELDDDNYTVDLGKATVAPAAAEASDANTITVSNTRKVTTLTIDKEVVGTNEDKAAQYTFTVTGPDGLEKTFTLADATKAMVIEKVPVGMTVTITETLNDKYSTTATANGAAATLNGGAMTYTIDENADNLVVYTNTRNVFAKSQIVKTMTAEDYAAMNDTDKLTITVEGQMFADGVYKDDTVSTPAFVKKDFVEQADGTYAYTWTIEGKQLLEGEDYTATESGNDNFTFSTVRVDTGTNLTTAVITTANAVKGGAIKVQKNAIVGYAGEDSTFTVEITGTMKNAAGKTVENVTITAEVTAGGDVVTVTRGTVDDVEYTLIAGQTYTVTETGIDNYTVGYVNQSNTAVADEDDAAVTTITNTRKGAQLTLTKTVEDVSTLVEGDTFTFTVERATDLSSAAGVQVTGEGKVSSTVNGNTITVVLKANTSATITGLFLNEPVTVTEADTANYELVSTDTNLVNGQLPAEGNVTFTNARKEADVLKVKKTMSSELALSQLPTGKIFTVEVTGSAYDTDEAGWTKADNGYTYTLTFNADEIKAGTEKEVPGALYGIAYTATEIGEGTSYTPSYSTNNGAMLSKTETGTVITVTNTPVTGELKIKKLIPSYYNDLTDQQNLSDDELIGTGLATVTVTAEGFKETYTFTKANVDAGYEWSVPGVVEGQTYTVTETWQHSELEYATQSHTTIVAGKSGSNTLATVTNNRRAYELTLNKSTDYVGDVAGNFTFVITGVFADSEGESVTREVTVTMNGAAGTAKVDNLLAGHTYSIEEKDSANYTFTVDGSETVSQNPFNYTNTDADKNGEVTLTVANTRVKADLKVTKTIDADTTLVGDEEFTLVVTGEFVDETGAVKAKELTFIFTAADLATKSDTKTIKEAVAIDGVDMTKLYAIKGGKYSVEETAGADNFDVTYTKKNVTLAADSSDELSVMNARKATGGLTVTKVVNGYMQDDETFTVRVTGVKFQDGTEGLKGETGEFYVEHTFTKAEVDAGTAWNVPGVLYGVEYKITEVGLDIATYKTEIIDPESVIMDATAQTATVTNEKQSGDLTVAKTMKDGKPVRSGDELALSVTGIFNTLTDGKVTGKTAAETVLNLYTDGSADGIVYNGTINKLGETFTLPAGYAAIVGETYTVTETITGTGDLAKVYATTFNGGENVTPVAGDGSDTRSFTFTYGKAEGQVNNVAIVNERLTAPLTLKKTLVDTTESAVDTRTFTFVIAADQDLTEGDVTWEDLEDGESVKPDYEADTVTVIINAANDHTTNLIVNLPVSVTYTITETDGAGYNTAATGLKDFNDANRSGSIELMDAAEVGFTNTRGSGALVVTKNIVGYDLTQNFTFTLTETNGGKVITTFELTDNGTVTISGLATDTQYTITETGDENYTTTETGDENYTTTVSVNGGTASEALYADVAITAKSNTTVAFTNTRDTGKLTVTKEMVGPVKAGDSFQLVVNGYKTVTDNRITFLVPTEAESEFATYTLKPGEATVIDGLMAGVEYTITEKLINGEIGTNYSAKWSDDTEGFVLENVAGGTNQAVTLTNTRDAKVIEVTKAISGDVMPLTGEKFVIQVTGAEGFKNADGNQIKDETGAVVTTATATFAYDQNAWTNDQTWASNELTMTVTVNGTDIVAYAYEGGTYTFTELTANGKALDDADCAWDAEHSDAERNTLDVYEMVEDTTAFTGTVTNTQKDAKLTVTKIFEGTMAKNEIFEISVTGVFTDSGNVATETTKTQKFYDPDLISSGTLTGSALTKDANGKYTATWDVPNVIFGNVYTVTEVIKVGDEVNEVRYEAAAITSNNQPANQAGTVIGDGNAQVEVVNTRVLTNLTITKEASNVTSDGGETFTFYITSDEITLEQQVKALRNGETEETLTFADGEATFELKEDESLTLLNLPKDVTFIVTEKVNANYTTINSHDEGEGLVGKIKLAEANKNNVIFTNNRDTGDLYVKKIADQLINGENTFYFTVKGNFAGENGVAKDETRSVTVIVAWDEEANAYVGTSAKVEDALQSETYTVTEYSDADHTQLMSRYTVNVNGEANDVVNVTFDSEDATQVVTNSADTAKLTVTKTFVGPVKEGDVFVVTINAELVNGKLVVTEDAAKMVAKELTEDANGKYTATFEGLIDGQEYTLTETLKNGELTTNYTYIWTYGDETAENADLTVTGTSADQTVELENTRKHTEAALVKTMEDADEIQLKEASNDEFAITVTGQFMYEADGQWLYTAATEAVTMTISGADGLNVPVALVEDGVTYYLVYGNKYTVTEEADDAYTATVLPGETFEFEGENVWESETATANIWVDNALEMKTLTVTKTVVDNSHEANALDNEFTFTYSRTDGLYGETFKLKNGQSKTFELPADVTATLVETENTGYTTVVKVNDAEETESFTAADVAEGTVAYTNTRILKTMDATKVVAGPDPITLVNETGEEIAFTFRVLKDGEPVEGVTLTIVEGDATRTATTGEDGTFTIYNGETATATNLADNYTYSFDEVDQPDFYLDPVITVDEETGLTTITNPREEKTLQVTKTLEEMTRALEGDTFTLKVTGRFTNDPDNDQTLTFVFDMNDGTLAQLGGEATKTLMEAEELKDLETEVFAYAGLTYELTEKAPDNFDEPVITAITEGETGYAGSVENIRSRSADVTLTKVVESVSLMDETDVFTITLNGEGVEMAQDIAYTDLTIDTETDTATFTWNLVEGQTLLDGETYTVAETVARDGVLLPEIAYGKTFEATGDVAEDGSFVFEKPEEANANVVTVTNLPEAPEPAVEKTADQANVQTGDTVTYTVTYTNTSYSAAVVTGIVDTYDERLTFVPGSVKVDGVEAADPIVDAEAHTLTFADLIVPAATEGETELIKGKITLTYQMSVALLETDNGHAEILNTIDGDCLEQELPADNTIIGDDPVITIEKKVSDEAVYAGEGYTYTIVVTNSGLVQGVVEVTDTLDHELIKFVEFSGTNPVLGVYEETSGVETLSWKFNIPAATQNEETGEITPAVYELSFKVNTVYAVDGTIIYNKATVESDDPFGEEESNKVETVIKNPPAFILKSADKEEVNPGEQLEYTIKVVSNSLAAHPVVVEDVIPDGMTFKSFVTLGLGGVQDAENPQKLTWSFEMPAATRVDEETITPAIVEIKFTVTADALTETNVDNVTNVAELDETPEDPTDDPIPSDPVDTKIESEVWVEKYSSTNFAYVGTTFMYVFRFYNTNTAPVTGRFVDYFNEYLAVVDFEKAPGTAGYEHVVGQQIYEDNSIGIDFELPAATANADGTVTPSWVDVGVYVQALKIPTDTSTTMTIPNTGAYRDDLSNEVKNTNTVYVLVEDTYVLPVTGEWTMYLVPVGALLVLLGVALMINERRRHLQGTGR